MACLGARRFGDRFGDRFGVGVDFRRRLLFRVGSGRFGGPGDLLSMADDRP